MFYMHLFIPYSIYLRSPYYPPGHKAANTWIWAQ